MGFPQYFRAPALFDRGIRVGHHCESIGRTLPKRPEAVPPAVGEEETAAEDVEAKR